MRTSIAFRAALRGKARDWNWHNVIGIWCALPLLVIALTGIVMSFDWANALLFRVTGSPPPASGRTSAAHHPRGRQSVTAYEPDYDQLLTAARTINADWRTITLNIPREASAPVTAVIDSGTRGQPQQRTQYLINRNNGAVLKAIAFSDGSLGQRLRAFVRFGHTGEYFGWIGQGIAALASLGACVLVYTGLSLAIRRLASIRKRSRLKFSSRTIQTEQPVA